MLTRSEVKSDKIGCIGFSMGGGRAIYLGALDKRINVVVSGGYVSSYKQLVKENMLFWPPSTWLPGILRYADCSGVVSLIAPRPLIIVNGRFDDSLSFQGMLDVYNKVERVYSFYKKEDNIKIFMLDEGHAFPKRVREKIYFWLGQWFGKNK